MKKFLALCVLALSEAHAKPDAWLKRTEQEFEKAYEGCDFSEGSIMAMLPDSFRKSQNTRKPWGLILPLLSDLKKTLPDSETFVEWLVSKKRRLLDVISQSVVENSTFWLEKSEKNFWRAVEKTLKKAIEKGIRAHKTLQKKPDPTIEKEKKVFFEMGFTAQKNFLTSDQVQKNPVIGKSLEGGACKGLSILKNLCRTVNKTIQKERFVPHPFEKMPLPVQCFKTADLPLTEKWFNDTYESICTSKRSHYIDQSKLMDQDLFISLVYYFQTLGPEAICNFLKQIQGLKKPPAYSFFTEENSVGQLLDGKIHYFLQNYLQPETNLGFMFMSFGQEIIGHAFNILCDKDKKISIYDPNFGELKVNDPKEAETLLVGLMKGLLCDAEATDGVQIFYDEVHLGKVKTKFQKVDENKKVFDLLKKCNLCIVREEVPIVRELDYCIPEEFISLYCFKNLLDDRKGRIHLVASHIFEDHKTSKEISCLCPQEVKKMNIIEKVINDDPAAKAIQAIYKWSKDIFSKKKNLQTPECKNVCEHLENMYESWIQNSLAPSYDKEAAEDLSRVSKHLVKAKTFAQANEVFSKVR